MREPFHGLRSSRDDLTPFGGYLHEKSNQRYCSRDEGPTLGVLGHRDRALALGGVDKLVADPNIVDASLDQRIIQSTERILKASLCRPLSRAPHLVLLLQDLEEPLASVRPLSLLQRAPAYALLLRPGVQHACVALLLEQAGVTPAVSGVSVGEHGRIGPCLFCARACEHARVIAFDGIGGHTLPICGASPTWCVLEVVIGIEWVFDVCKRHEVRATVPECIQRLVMMIEPATAEKITLRALPSRMKRS